MSELVNNETFIDRHLDGYLVNDIRFNYNLRLSKGPALNLIFIARNILNEQYISNAYTYRFITVDTATEVETAYEDGGYYPQAGRNFLAGLTLTF